VAVSGVPLRAAGLIDINARTSRSGRGSRPDRQRSACVTADGAKPGKVLRGRRARACRTIDAMVRMYCAENHAGVSPCPDCSSLLAYATRRIERCVFGDDKPNCADCTVHCYRADMRERVRVMMRWAGPRLMLRHPVLTVLHMIDGLRKPPMLAPPPARTRGGDE
jgi:hypothetical protein